MVSGMATPAWLAFPVPLSCGRPPEASGAPRRCLQGHAHPVTLAGLGEGLPDVARRRQHGAEPPAWEQPGRLNKGGARVPRRPRKTRRRGVPTTWILASGRGAWPNEAEESGAGTDRQNRSSLARDESWAFALYNVHSKVSDVLQLRFLEDSSARPSPPPPGPAFPDSRAQRRGARGIVDADRAALRRVGGLIQWWLGEFRVPLQSEYDPDQVAAYFFRRPHLLAMRLAQVSFALGSTWLRISLDTIAIRRAETDGMPSDSPEIGVIRRRSAARLKKTLLRLGPTFVKVAQSISTRPDLVGPDTTTVLAELQDRLPPFPTDAAVEVIRTELGLAPGETAFPVIDPEPVAAASLGQVYRAQTAAGEVVAVKVQRPGVLFTVARDICILRILLRILRRVARINSDLALLADELGRGLYGELDYRQEAANAEAFAAAHRHMHEVVVPRIHHTLTSRRVLTMEWIEGERTSELLALAQIKDPVRVQAPERKAEEEVAQGYEWYRDSFRARQKPAGLVVHLEPARVAQWRAGVLQWLGLAGWQHSADSDAAGLKAPLSEAELEAQQALVEQQRDLARAKLLTMVGIGVECSLEQLLGTGLLHADPHPGNLLFTAGGRLAYLDFGLLCRMERQHQAAMLGAIAHLVNGEWAKLTEDLAAMDVLKPSTDRNAVTLALREAFSGSVSEAPAGGGFGRTPLQFGQISSSLWKMALRFRFRLPPYYTLVLRSLASLEGIAIAVDPKFRVFACAYPYVIRRLLTDSSPESQRVLRDLVLTPEGRLRWDRFSAFAATSNLATREEAIGLAAPSLKQSLEARWGRAPGPSGPGSPESPVSIPVGGRRKADKSIAALVFELILSQEAVPARRVLLDSDIQSLAEAFVSCDAVPARERLVGALAEAMYRPWKERVGHHAEEAAAPMLLHAGAGAASGLMPVPAAPVVLAPGPGQGLPEGVVLPLPAAAELSVRDMRGLAVAVPGAGTGDRRRQRKHKREEPEATASAVRRKRFWFLLRCAFSRMGQRPLLKLQVLLTALAIVLAALVQAAQRLLRDSLLQLWRAIGGQDPYAGAGSF